MFNVLWLSVDVSVFLIKLWCLERNSACYLSFFYRLEHKIWPTVLHHSWGQNWGKAAETRLSVVDLGTQASKPALSALGGLCSSWHEAPFSGPCLISLQLSALFPSSVSLILSTCRHGLLYMAGESDLQKLQTHSHSLAASGGKCFSPWLSLCVF